MSNNLNIQKVLKDTEALLQDIEGELHFSFPHSKKLDEIRNTVLWLKGGEPKAFYRRANQTLEWPESSSLDKANLDPFGNSFDDPFSELDDKEGENEKL